MIWEWKAFFSITLQNQYAVIQSTINALKGQEIRGLVTLGPVLEKQDFSVPDNVIVVESAPHSKVFPLASMVIKVQHHGCGIALSANAGPDKILKAIQKILTNEAFKQAAGKFQEDIRISDQTTFVLQELEDLMVPVQERNPKLEEASVRYA